MTSANKKLMVCGDSFSALTLDDKHKGTHFSEILSKKLGYDLVNLAFRGCSNGGIRIQIEEVIRQKPDFAIIIPSFFDRIELPVTGLKPDFKKFSWFEFDQFIKLFKKESPEYTGYDENNGINNINSSHSANPSLICENFVSIINNWTHPYRRNIPLSDEVVQCVKDYLSYMYDANWKKQQDKWIIEHGAVELIKNNIPFLLIPTLSLWQPNDIPLVPPKLIDEKYYVIDEEHCPLRTSYKPEYILTDDWLNNHAEDPGYHTNYAGQEYLADKYFKLIQNRWNLC